MEKILKFYKTEKEGLWFIYLPEYIVAGGNPVELQMVAGADEFLDILGEGKDEVDIQILNNPEGIQLTQKLVRMDYIPNQVGKHYQDFMTNKLMWLCPVTLFIFGEYPAEIYYQKL